ncbi:MAG: histidinol-phosphate transaminase [Lentisphaerae bacterium]|nr:histidinol-phosphate transaminase [Lentisphaerota bacterium]
MNRYVTHAVQALHAYTPGEQPQATGIVKLNTNENPYPPSPAVGQALAAFDPARLRLYPDPLCVAVRERIAVMHGCSPQQVFVGNGSDEILALCTRAFVEDAGTVGYFDPSYSLYPVLADIRKAEKRPVRLSDDFRWQMPAHYQASLFFLTNPNAPTSLLFPCATVAAFCTSFDGVVLIDEAYADFSRSNCMALAVRAENENTLVMRTLSKAFSLAGLRFGYVIGPEPLIAALYKIKDSYNLDVLAQVAGLAALNDLEHMRANVRRIQETRSRLTAELRRRGWTVLDSETNFLFARPPQERAVECFERLRYAGIYVRHFPNPRTAAYLRITVGTDSQVEAFLQQISG